MNALSSGGLRRRSRESPKRGPLPLEDRIPGLDCPICEGRGTWLCWSLIDTFSLVRHFQPQNSGWERTLIPLSARVMEEARAHGTWHFFHHSLCPEERTREKESESEKVCVRERERERPLLRLARRAPAAGCRLAPARSSRSACAGQGAVEPSCC